MRRILGCILVVGSALLVTGCGKKGHQASWPARALPEAGMPTDQLQSLRSAISQFNERMGSAALLTESDGDEFPISFRVVPPSSKNPKRLGLATLTDSDCLIELNSKLFGSENSALLESVVWHELGHCAGKEHDPSEGEIMYRTARPVNQYSEASIARFFQELLNLSEK